MFLFSEVVFGLIASIVVCGLITLIIWKCITVLHDRKELEKFEEERQKAAWNNVSLRNSHSRTIHCL